MQAIRLQMVASPLMLTEEAWVIGRDPEEAVRQHEIIRKPNDAGIGNAQSCRNLSQDKLQGGINVGEQK